jgi:oligopeptide transport system ATP-binding protein
MKTMAGGADQQTLLRVEDLQVWFPAGRPVPGRRPRTWVRAVDGISLHVERGETLGLVGESGSGKSTVALALLRLVEPTAGRVLLDGVDVTYARGAEAKALRRRIAMVFQDPYGSLNPRRTVADSIREPLEVHKLLPKGPPQGRRVSELLDAVGLPAQFGGRYPHELSGGQRQRVGIARALASDPELIVLDEPIASLDVSMQAQIMNLLRVLQREFSVAYLFIAHDLAQKFGLSYIFISHDLSVVKRICDRIAVMYLGRIVETGDREALYSASAHPYTRALLSAVPPDSPWDGRASRRVLLEGDIPSPVSPPSGCRFRTRCPLAITDCARTDPPPTDVGPGHWAACIRTDEVDRAMG